MTDTDKKFSQDEELSDFTDHILNGQIKNAASASDQELRGLEDTILRLHNNMPTSLPLEESTKKQMLVRLNARIRREKEQPQKKSFWASLFNPEMRPQFALAMGVVALLIAVVIISPSIAGMDGSSTTGAALSDSNGVIVPAVLIGLVVLILWIKRKR